MRTLVISPAVWDDLHTYLDHPVERMAFLTATPLEDSNVAADVWSVMDVMYLDDETDYVNQGSAAMELADEIRPRSLQWATRHSAALVEVHSHGTGLRPTTFSDHDLRGLIDGVPPLVWRLHGRPYGAIVFGGHRDFDAVVWHDRASPPAPIVELTVGAITFHATARALERITDLGVLDA
jgi:hypothetical protein